MDMDNYYIYKNSDCKKNVKVFNLHEDIKIVKEFKNNKSFIDYNKVDFKYTKNILKEEINIPNSWSWRYNGLNRIEIGGIRNQGNCDISWAFSLISALGDRYAIKYNIAAPYLSVLYFLLYSKPKNINQSLCFLPGNTYKGLKWLETNHTILEICWPWKIVKDNNYKFPSNLEELKNCCFNCCNDQDIKIINKTQFSCKKNSTNLIVSITPSSNIDIITIDIPNTILAIQKEIIKNGPVISTFNLYDDFLYYWENDAKDKKIYIRTSKKQLGQHSVVITGWGIRDNIRFWEVRNSWGNKGDQGYFYIAFSQDTKKDTWCNIDIPSYRNQNFECGVISFLPDELNNIELFKKASEQVPHTTSASYYPNTSYHPNIYSTSQIPNLLEEQNDSGKAFSISEEKNQIYTKLPKKDRIDKREDTDNIYSKEISLDINLDKKSKTDNFIFQKILLYFCIVIIVILIIIIIVKVINKKYSNDIYKYFSFSTSNQIYSENFHHPIVLPY